MDITELKRIEDKRLARHPWERARAGMVRFLVRHFKPESIKVLDIGSGDAFLLNTLRQNYISKEYIGVDTAYDAGILKRLRDSGVPESIILLDHLNSLKGNAEKADTCLLLDVLEHCEDARALLVEARNGEISSEDSFFFITVPAFQALFSGHDELLGHYRRYSRKQLSKLCRSADLRVIASGYFFFSLIPARYLQILREKLSGKKSRKSLDAWRGGELLARIFYAILWADSRICYLLSRLGIHLPGLSAYAICRKQPS